MTESFPNTPESGISPDHIEPAEWQAVPEAAHRLLQEEGVDDSRLRGLARLRHANGDTTLFATYQGMMDEFIDEVDTLVIDHTLSGEVTGAGVVQFFNRFKGASDMVGYPFVGFTKTNPDMLRRGLAERRLVTMNAFALAMYQQPLRSGAHLAPEIKPLWEKMVASGAAVRLGADAASQYSFR